MESVNLRSAPKRSVRSLPGKVEARLRAAGAADIQFVDDHRYQDNLGNVHCATNTLKLPVVADFSKALPTLQWQDGSKPQEGHLA